MTSVERSSSFVAPRKLLTIKVAAKRLGYGPDYVSRLCRNRELNGVRVDRAWFIDEESLRLFEQSRSMRKDFRSNELSRQRRAEAAAVRAEARRPLILASVYLLATVVAGGGGTSKRAGAPSARLLSKRRSGNTVRGIELAAGNLRPCEPLGVGERPEYLNAPMKLALLFGCYLALVTILCVWFAASNPVYVAHALLAISAMALFAALILTVCRDFHLRLRR